MLEGTLPIDSVVGAPALSKQSFFYGQMFAEIFVYFASRLISNTPEEDQNICSTSLPGGNQVDGLPTASSLNKLMTLGEKFELFRYF